MKRYLAIDIGASSGRHIIGWKEHGVIKTEEVYRFPNFMDKQDGHLVWDISRLESEVKKGIAEAKSRYSDIVSLSIDTWGVDYVLMKGEKEILPCYAYRDSRTEEVIEKVHEIVSPDFLYERTGIQFQPFNTIYQLYCDKLAGRLDEADDFLMLPEYLMYKLTGIKKREYTNATTGGLINAFYEQYDEEIINRLTLPNKLFGEVNKPGTPVGEYDGIKVVLCATHDTASAYEGVELPEKSLFLSSGTWSLLGAKCPKPLTGAQSKASNFTNEGGVGYIRYLKNIMGLWIIQNLHKELGLGFAEMVELSRKSSYKKTFDVNDKRFAAPENMRNEITSALGEDIEDRDVINSVYHSLALSYAQTIREIESITGNVYNDLVIVGGGAKNSALNRLTQEYTEKNIIAIPFEATSLGNIKVQMEADK